MGFREKYFGHLDAIANPLTIYVAAETVGVTKVLKNRVGQHVNVIISAVINL